MKKSILIISVISLMLASFTAGVEYQRGDVDQDGIVNIHDVTFLMNYLLEGSWPDEPVTPPDNHEWVDLGLPSGTLWATCNVGANAPEEYGDHFAWGETSPKEVYNWSTYQWCNGSMFTLTKYNTQSSLGMVDNKTELDPEDDAAYVNWGPSWRTPTTDQQNELMDKCSWARTTQNGVHGFRVTGPNGNSLFLPAAGYRLGASVSEDGTEGWYWSSTSHAEDAGWAGRLYFWKGDVNGWASKQVYRGHSVRLVRDAN